MGTFWKILEDLKRSEDEAVHIFTNELLYYAEQIVPLLEQNNNVITYPRSLNFL